MTRRWAAGWALLALALGGCAGGPGTVPGASEPTLGAAGRPLRSLPATSEGAQIAADAEQAAAASAIAASHAQVYGLAGPDPSREIMRGRASWYGPRFHGRRTASGERFDMNALTAAHRSLPFGTRVLVRNLANGREVTVRINDRGPYSRGRIIDLSRGAAEVLDLVRTGEARVVLFTP